MIVDYIFGFPSEAAAIADPQVGTFYREEAGVGAWDGSCCIPNLSVTVLGTGQPTTVTNQDGSTQTVPGPNAPLDALWRIAIARRGRDASLEQSVELEIVADRDAANAGAPLATYILRSSVPIANLAALVASPQFAGSNYVYGAT